MSFSQKRDQIQKYSSHSLDKSFDQSSSSSPERKKKTKKLQLNIRKKKPTQRPTTASPSTQELILFPINKKSKFSYNENEIFPESTKSVVEKNLINEQVLTFIKILGVLTLSNFSDEGNNRRR